MKNNDPYAISPTMDITTLYKTISAKGKLVMHEKKLQGETMHLAPLGFKNTRDEMGRSVTVIDPVTHRLGLEAKKLQDEGRSVRKICFEMERRGLRSKRGKRVNASGMWRVLGRIP